MAKHLIDLDEEALRAATAALGTPTMKDTVNAALRRVASESEQQRASALDALASIDFDDRADAWR